jgi:AmpE protein
MEFLVILISLLLVYLNGSVPGIQRDRWYQSWVESLRKRLAPGKHPEAYLMISLVVPVLGVVLLLWLASGWLMGLPYLALNTLLLLYAFGRNDLAVEAHAYTSALSRGDTQGAYHKAAVFNFNHNQVAAEDGEGLHTEAVRALSYRYFEHYFAVIFWFCVLGAPIAVLYRLAELHTDLALDAEDEKPAAEQWLWLMEWLPARLMGLSLAAVGNFSACFQRWRKSLTNTEDSTATVLNDYVLAAGLDNSSPTQQVRSVQTLYWRALVLVVSVLALLTIFG